jgi:hypothetical protein
MGINGVLPYSVEAIFESWASSLASPLAFGFVHLFNPAKNFAGAIYIAIEVGLLRSAVYLASPFVFGCASAFTWAGTLAHPPSTPLDEGTATLGPPSNTVNRPLGRLTRPKRRLLAKRARRPLPELTR